MGTQDVASPLGSPACGHSFPRPHPLWLLCHHPFYVTGLALLRHHPGFCVTPAAAAAAKVCVCGMERISSTSAVAPAAPIAGCDQAATLSKARGAAQTAQRMTKQLIVATLGYATPASEEQLVELFERCRQQAYGTRKRMLLYLVTTCADFDLHSVQTLFYNTWEDQLYELSQKPVVLELVQDGLDRLLLKMDGRWAFVVDVVQTREYTCRIDEVVLKNERVPTRDIQCTHHAWVFGNAVPARGRTPALQLLTGSPGRQHDTDKTNQLDRACRLPVVDAKEYRGLPADDKLLLTVHSESHLTRVAGNSKAMKTWKGNTYYTNGTDQAARLAVSAYLETVKECIRSGCHGLCLARPPGHHAMPDGANGDDGGCVYNTMAIAATSQMRDEHKVLIIDWDVHQGNGTLACLVNNLKDFWSPKSQEPSECMFMMLDYYGECKRRPYPQTKYVLGRRPQKVMRTTPLPHMDGLKAQLRKDIEELVSSKEFEPDVVLVSCGFDGAQDDKFDGCLRPEDFAELFEMLHYRFLRVPIVMLLEGGYEQECNALCVRKLQSFCPPVRSGFEWGAQADSSVLRMLYGLEKVMFEEGGSLHESPLKRVTGDIVTHLSGKAQSESVLAMLRKDDVCVAVARLVLVRKHGAIELEGFAAGPAAKGYGAAMHFLLCEYIWKHFRCWCTELRITNRQCQKKNAKFFKNFGWTGNEQEMKSLLLLPIDKYTKWRTSSRSLQMVQREHSEWF